jgi:hypothetical protein
MASSLELCCRSEWVSRGPRLPVAMIWLTISVVLLLRAQIGRPALRDEFQVVTLCSRTCSETYSLLGNDLL